MERKFGDYQGELKIFVTIDREGNEDYTFNRLTPEQRGLAEVYLRKLNEFTITMSGITKDLTENIVKSLKEKGHSRIEIETMGSVELKKGDREIIIYKNLLK